MLTLLGISTHRARALAASVREQTRALRRERWLRESAQMLAVAARRSSAAVFTALDERVRAFDPHFDAMLAFVVTGDELACAYASGQRSEHYRHVRLRRDDGRTVPARAAASRCRVVSEGDGALLASDRYALAVPLCDADVRAVVYLSSSAYVTPVDVDALVEGLEAAAVPYASAVERESDRNDATHDGLTGLLSPRAFRRQLHEELARVEASATESIVSLWFVDTDGFKSINDQHGHPAGDVVLQTMASLLKAHLVPGTDLAARNGGDEFCALIRNASKTAAVERARRFLEAVRRHEFAVPASITASIGVATYPHDARSSNDLLELADAAMYHGKRSGRNRVSFVVSPGRFASVGAEAETRPSRSPERWSSPRAGSSVDSFS
ncbi:MAG TPA: GGDEF domain-containing protein [Candidatus Baltobacteraceae bacterium]|nr:GGDEF domain-containing protein [Candidatus Baltobacteraceae bacterium]